ncbi:phosphatidyl inositol kinase [Mortierella sp. AD094]|nr:phosphatidyl inositol kinase [Mortierella sp. AD094]
MPNKHGYLPLGQDDQDIQDQATTINIDDNDIEQLEQHQQAPLMQQEHGFHVTVTIPSSQEERNANNTNNNTRPLFHEEQLRQQKSDVATTASAPTPSPLRPSTHATLSAPVAPSPSSFQFPRFGVKNKSLLGISSFSSSSNNNNEGSSNNNNTDGNHSSNGGVRKAVSSTTVPDLLNIRRKQHGHTTESGPRGIEKSQKQKVLQEIRPDLHNLPEELLREQARSGAAVDALQHQHQHQQQQQQPQDETTRLLNNGDNNNSTSNPAAGSGTLLGSGDGLGLGIGLGGKANNTRSRWTGRPMGRRQRRVPSSGIGRENDQRVIQSSVFTPVLASVYDGQAVAPAPALTPDHAEPMTSERFVSIVNTVKEAIRSGIQPLRIAQGSSGSYFCRNLDGKIVGVFKPKNEEPYGQLNPKWAKWIHRNLFPLIPNLGYISEAATSLVDRRLKLNIVPSTEVVWLSSSAFHYDYLDRRAAQLHKGAKPLPDKVGSFQLFLNGFKDANLFMRDHPWPVETGLSGVDINGKGKYSTIKKRSSSMPLPDGTECQHDEDGASVSGSSTGSAYGGFADVPGCGPDKPGFNWTPALQQQFREQFEKMIILDYLIRNTDRGLDNWMIRYCEKEGISIVAGPPSGDQKGNPQQQQQQQQDPTWRNSRVGDLLGLYSGSPRSSSPSLREATGRNAMLATPPGTPPRSSIPPRAPSGADLSQDEPYTETAENANGTTAGSSNAKDPAVVDPAAIIESYYGSTHVHAAAIDNGLAFPFKHPDSWRSYPYGWLFLPHPLISQPFTKATRDHFLPLLSSPTWWRETIADLRRLFSIDSDFDQGMFDKQMAVMKGQGWNIVETLKNLEHGPMDLCRRVAVVVWDEEVTLEPGITASMLRRQESRQSLAGEGGYGATAQTYTTTQPKPMTMDANKTAYSNYGSISSVTNRMSNPKTLSTSSTAIGEVMPFLTADQKNSLKQASFKHASFIQGSFKQAPSYKQSSLPYLAIDIDNSNHDDDANGQPKHESFRQVVSDGEYDLSDDFDEDDDAFSYDEEYDDFEENAPAMDGLSTSQTQLSPVTKDSMISLDMALTNPEAVTRSHRRRHSHQSDGGRSRRSRQFSVGSGDANTQNRPAATEREDSSAVPATTPVSPTTKSNHRRSRTEQDDRTGTVRFDTVSSDRSQGRANATNSGVECETMSSSLLLLQSPPSKSSSSGGINPFDSPEDNKVVDREPEVVERGRSFFARGYGVNRSSDHQDDMAAGNGEGGRLSERPKWADRLRRGLSFDGHLLVGGIGQAARRERYLRKQKQRERELRENRVILVERIEPVTKNLPYFTWW